MTDKGLLTKQEAAARLGISEKTLDRWEEDGRLTRVALAGRPRYRPEDVERLIQGQQPEEATRGPGQAPEPSA